MGTQEMKTKKTLAVKAKINTLAKRFEDDEIDRTEHLEGISLLYRIFFDFIFSGFRDNT